MHGQREKTMFDVATQWLTASNERQATCYAAFDGTSLCDQLIGDSGWPPVDCL